MSFSNKNVTNIVTNIVTNKPVFVRHLTDKCGLTRIYNTRRYMKNRVKAGVVLPPKYNKRIIFFIVFFFIL